MFQLLLSPWLECPSRIVLDLNLSNFIMLNRLGRMVWPQVLWLQLSEVGKGDNTKLGGRGQGQEERTKPTHASIQIYRTGPFEDWASLYTYTQCTDNGHEWIESQFTCLHSSVFLRRQNWIRMRRKSGSKMDKMPKTSLQRRNEICSLYTNTS